MAAETVAQSAPAVPVLGPRIVETLITDKLAPDVVHRLILVNGRYAPGAASEFTVRIGDVPRTVTVAEQHSVLGIAHAWHSHRAAAPDGDSLLVVVTEVADRDLGWDLRGHALGNLIHDVDRAKVVQQRFGATQVDARIRTEPWLVTALLDAEPRTGWPRSGGLLTRDMAMRALAAARLGLIGTEEPVGALPDLDALLAWSRTASGPASFAALHEDEQRELTRWLSDVAGPAARQLLALVAAGRGEDAMPLGVVGAVVDDPSGPPSAEAGLALGALFGRRVDLAELKAFTAAVQGALDRWLADTGANARQQRPDNRGRALEVLRRADAVAAEEGLTATLAHSVYLPSGLDARLRALAAALGRSAEDAGRALVQVEEHRLAAMKGDRLRAAEAAVRLVRWLEVPTAGPVSVADGLARHIADLGWADAALTVLWAGDPDPDGAVAAAYAAVCERVRRRRSEFDEVFAQRLAGWTQTAHTIAKGGCLLVENVLADVAYPLRGKGKPAPLVLVLDGMSSAVAVELAAELGERTGWVEAARHAGRRDAAAAVIPSLTRLSRASLLAGELAAGGQSVEKDGFTEFWSRHRDPQARLFHKAEIPGRAGRRLSDELQDALAGTSVVGVVLNTIDESLDHAAQGDRTGWRLSDVTYLEEVLDAARSYGRPVVLTADHGHVLERREGDDAPAASSGEVRAARWRTGEPRDGELLLAGPRVQEGGGEVVVPWREDIRYSARKGGYHGGAALAEMTVPVLVFLPATELLPKGWSLLAPEDATPGWWAGVRDGATVTLTDTAGACAPVVDMDAAPPVLARPAVRVAESTNRPADKATGPPRAAGQGETDASDVGAPTFGRRIVGSEVYQAQKTYVRRGPKAAEVAAAIDAFVAADGTLSTTAAATAAGFAPARAAGLMAMLQRLLNVEGYPVLESIDGGARLRFNIPLARQQFQVDAE